MQEICFLIVQMSLTLPSRPGLGNKLQYQHTWRDTDTKKVLNLTRRHGELPTPSNTPHLTSPIYRVYGLELLQ